MAVLAAGEIKANTLEQALLEIAMKMQLKERVTGANPEGKNNVTLTINTDAATASLNVTLSLTQSVDTATGAITFIAAPYLT